MPAIPAFSARLIPVAGPVPMPHAQEDPRSPSGGIASAARPGTTEGGGGGGGPPPPPPPPATTEGRVPSAPAPPLPARVSPRGAPPSRAS
jgi:hypothetical protein